MSSDPPEQVGKGLFGYRRSAVNQIIADRDIMLRQAEGRVRSAESKVAELEDELSSQRERNSRMDEQLDRLRQQLDLLMTRTEGMAAGVPAPQVEAEPMPSPEPTAAWEDDAPSAPTPWAGEWDEGGASSASPRHDEGLDEDEATMFGEPAPFGSEAPAYDVESPTYAEVPADEDESPTDDPERAPGDAEAPSYRADVPVYDAGSRYEMEEPAPPPEMAHADEVSPVSPFDQPEDDDIPYGVQMGGFDAGPTLPEESSEAWMNTGPEAESGSGEPEPAMLHSEDPFASDHEPDQAVTAEAEDEPAYGFDPFTSSDEATQPSPSDSQPGAEGPTWAMEESHPEEEPEAVEESHPEEQPEPAAQPVAQASQAAPVSSEATDITNRFLTEELTGILTAAEESAARIVERARATTQHQIAQSNRLWREVQSEVSRFASWREDVEPVIHTVQSKVEGVRERIEEVPERIRQALAPMADAISSIDTDLAELAAACSPPLLLAPGGLEGGESLTWDVKTPEVEEGGPEPYGLPGSEGDPADRPGDHYGEDGGERHAG